MIVADQTRRMVERKPAGEDATGRKVRPEKSNVSPRKRRSCKNPKPQHHGPEVEKVWLDKAFTGARRSGQQAREDPERASGEPVTPGRALAKGRRPRWLACWLTWNVYLTG